MNYQNNKAEAIAGDDRNSYIKESGAQVGIFTMAKAITAKKGSKGVEFSFKSNDGATANYQTLYTENAKGESIFGYKQLCGIMTILGVDGIVGQQSTIKEYDFDLKQEIDKIATIYPNLINQPIGVIFQKEQYYKNDSTMGERVNMWGFFRAADNATVMEVGKGLQSDGSRLNSMVEGLKDKLIKPLAETNASMIAGDQYAGQVAPQGNDFDDDLPY